MERLGFAEGLDGLWLRADNLALSRDGVARRVFRLFESGDGTLWAGKGHGGRRIFRVEDGSLQPITGGGFGRIGGSDFAETPDGRLWISGDAGLFVVDGGIYRHEFVAQTGIDGLMSGQLETEMPVLSMVLTPQRFHEHEEHVAFFTGHMTKKGAEAAIACVHTIRGIEAIAAPASAKAA